MPHSLTEIYISGSYGVTLEDIASVIGGPQDLGTLCTSNNINMWAKYKPVSQNTYKTTGKTAGNTYWQAANLKCGLNIPEYNGWDSTFMNALLGSSALWSHDKPTSTYRILDFDGYDDNAPAPMEQPYITNLQVGYNGDLQVDYDEVQIQGNDSIKFSDIKIHNSYLSSWYFGILIYSNSYKYEYYTSQSPIGSSASNLSVTFSGMNSYDGDTVQIVPFLASSAITTQSTAPASGYFISFNLSPISVSITAASSGISVSFDMVQWNATGTQVDYELTLSNSNSTSRAISNIILCLYDGRPTDQGTQMIDTRTISSVVVPGNGSAPISGSFQKNMDDEKTYWFTINTGGTTLIPYTEWPVDYDPPTPDDSEPPL